MISAKEAKELYEKSGAEVKQYLDHKIEPKIKDAANAGKRSVFVVEGSVVAYSHPTMTPLQQGVKDELIKLGFVVKFEKDTTHSYIPAGLRQDDGNGPTHQNYGFMIGW